MENVEAERAACTVTRKPDEDLALVQAVRTGDMSAFEKLVRKYDRKLLRIALNVLHNVEDAEDAVQEAFVKAYQKLDQFRADAKFSTWLTRIVLNQSFMKLRKQRAAREQSIDIDFHEKSGDGLPFDLADWAPNPEQLYSADEFRQILIKVLRTLPPGQRSVFILRDIEGLSTLEAAETLHLTQTTVKSQLSRARLELRERLSKYFKVPASCGNPCFCSALRLLRVRPAFGSLPEPNALLATIGNKTLPPQSERRSVYFTCFQVITS